MVIPFKVDDNKIMIPRWLARNRDALRSCTSRAIECDDASNHVEFDVQGNPYIKSEFYTFPGTIGHWRFPLRYPYQIAMLQNFNHGIIGKYDADSSNSEDMRYINIADAVSAIAWNEQYAVLKMLSAQPKSFFQWGILDFKTGKMSLFSTEEELYTQMKVSKLELKPLEWHYKQFEQKNYVGPKKR